MVVRRDQMDSRYKNCSGTVVASITFLHNASVWFHYKVLEEYDCAVTLLKSDFEDCKVEFLECLKSEGTLQGSEQRPPAQPQSPIDSYITNSEASWYNKESLMLATVSFFGVRIALE